MKKSLLLISVLALAACGGGSGGGVSRPATQVNLGSQYSKIACKSDRSECRGIIVDANGNNTISESRIASARFPRAAATHGNITVGTEQWDLFYADDIDMNIIYSPGHLAKQTFIVDAQGNITGMKWSGDPEVAEYVPGVVLSGMEYIGDNKFNLKSSESDGTLEFENYDDLKFANFGVVKVRNMKWTGHNVGEGNMDIPFAGGYNVLKQNPAENLPSKTIKYTGTARGMLEYAGDKAGGDFENDQDYLNVIAQGATLTIDTNGSKPTETFVANFVNADDTSKAWHSLNATKTDDAITFNFSGDNQNEDKFTMTGYVLPENTKIFDTGYYSDVKDTPSEASGLFQYQEVINPANTDIQGNNRTLYVGFGGKAPTE